MQVAFDYEQLETPIKSVTCLNPEGQEVHALKGDAFHERGGGVWFGIPEMSRIHLRVVSFDKVGAITVPIRLDTGVGF